MPIDRTRVAFSLNKFEANSPSPGSQAACLIPMEFTYHGKVQLPVLFENIRYSTFKAKNHHQITVGQPCCSLLYLMTANGLSASIR
jgi:hypothetical protein